MKTKFQFIATALLSSATLGYTQENNVWTVDQAEGITQQVDTQKDEPISMIELESEIAKETNPVKVVTLCIQAMQSKPNTIVETVAQGTRRIVQLENPSVCLLLLQRSNHMAPALGPDILHAVIANLGSYQEEWAAKALTLMVRNTESAETKGILLNTALETTKNNPITTNSINQAAQQLGLEE